MKSQSKQTICVHEGRVADKFSGINTPVYTSTSYGYLDREERYYPRYFNVPNQKALIDKLSRLENTESGLIFGSGMAAISTTLLSLLGKGDHAIFQKGLYGGTIHFIRQDLERFGIEFTIAASNPISAFENAIRKNTKVIFIESPSNPLLSVTDLEAIANLCKSRNIISVIDNTFASPINQNPADSGIDLIIHSATKYLGGHSDISAGAVLGKEEHIAAIKATSLNLGGTLNPQMCHLLERSMKTLAIRVARQNENAMRIARFLHDHPKITKIYYPGLPDHEGYGTAKKQMLGFGGMLSFELEGQDSYEFQKRLELIRPAMSLGGIESTICSPALTSHRHLTKEQREDDGIRDSLLRLSVGIEDVDELVQDLEQAFERKRI